ncbi:MAG: hypothetical protein V4458_06085, partial [Pseudomonadota bacterium]
MARITGLIFTLDLGVRAGFAKGRPGEMPTSGIVILRSKQQSLADALGNLAAFLHEQFTSEKPACVVKETVMALEAFKQMNMSQDSVYAQVKYHGVVEMMCNRFGIPWSDLSDSTARKHFIGKGRMGSRDATKAAVVARCHALGYFPKDCNDDNRADAVA